ncbi:hypothetical protein A3Q56_00589 [Intoshia linei]|uniref:Etoposide-induced protein 2.4 n=1 Tax=Intoshia linei TaxID=1819745 RepID=A0A177BBN8_9BILA|nr:hypothetical protein A3Q56_00589 [Intoshia linei]
MHLSVNPKEIQKRPQGITEKSSFIEWMKCGFWDSMHFYTFLMKQSQSKTESNGVSVDLDNEELLYSSKNNNNNMDSSSDFDYSDFERIDHIDESNNIIKSKKARLSQSNTYSNLTFDQYNYIKKHILLTSFWNIVVFMSSLLIFEYLFLPLMGYLANSFGLISTSNILTKTLSIFFTTIWIYPMFIIGKVINSFWFQRVSNVMFRRFNHTPYHQMSFSRYIADSIFSTVVELIFFIQSMFCSLIPIYLIRFMLQLLHYALLYSLYTFEYKWYHLNIGIKKKLLFIHNKWPYFLGFGLPLALITSIMITSPIISGCLFSSLFPLYIISANESNIPHVNFIFPVKFFRPSLNITNFIFLRVKKSQPKLK